MEQMAQGGDESGKVNGEVETNNDKGPTEAPPPEDSSSSAAAAPPSAPAEAGDGGDVSGETAPAEAGEGTDQTAPPVEMEAEQSVPPPEDVPQANGDA